MPDPSLLNTILETLGVHQPPVLPTPTPEQQRLHEQLMQRQLQDQPAAQLLDKGFGAVGDTIKGAFADPTMPRAELDKMSPWAKGGLLMAAAPLPTSGIEGLYSRLHNVAESLPAKINPNKLKSILAARTTADEQSWRKVPEFLQSFIGANKDVPKDEFVQHLAQNPLGVNVIEKGGERPIAGHVLDGAGGIVHPDWERVDYSNYTMPGGTNYRETLLQLEPKPHPAGLKWTVTHNPSGEVREFTSDGAARNFAMSQPRQGDFTIRHPEEITGPNWRELQAQEEPPPFVGQHWNEPNVLVHVRHNERNLPNPNLYNTWDAKYMGDGYRATRSGTLGPRENSPNEAIEKAEQFRPSGPLGRMLENIQSDWHQHGAHSGYSNQPNIDTDTLNQHLFDARALLNRVNQEVLAHMQTLPQEIRMRTEPNVGDWDPEELAHNLNAHLGYYRNNGYPELTPLQEKLQQARVTYDNANDAAVRSAGKMVPDAPFKDSWAELALKQQLLDVAKRPDLQWIGLPPAHVLNARGEGVSEAFQDQQLPRTLEKLLKPFGGTVEKVGLGIKPEASYTLRDTSHHYGQIERRLPGGEREPVASLISPYNRAEDSAAVVKALENQTPDIKAVIARLTPEMKQQILQKGFPLLTALMMMRQQNQGTLDAAKPAQPIK